MQCIGTVAEMAVHGDMIVGLVYSLHLSVLTMFCSQSPLNCLNFLWVRRYALPIVALSLPHTVRETQNSLLEIGQIR